MRKYVVPVFFIISISLFLYLLSRSFTQEEIVTFVESAGIFAPLVFSLLLLLTLVLAPFSGTPLMFAGYYAFGQKVIIYSVVTTYLSFILNFWIARKWGRRIVKKLVGEDGMKKVDSLTKDYGLIALVLLRLFQGSISDFVSFAMGLTNMKFRIYFIVSVLASIPGTTIWYLLSLNAETPTEFTVIMLIFTLTLSLVFVLGGLVWNKLKVK